MHSTDGLRKNGKTLSLPLHALSKYITREIPGTFHYSSFQNIRSLSGVSVVAPGRPLPSDSAGPHHRPGRCNWGWQLLETGADWSAGCCQDAQHDLVGPPRLWENQPGQCHRGTLQGRLFYAHLTLTSGFFTLFCKGIEGLF